MDAMKDATTEHRPEWLPPETEREQALRLAYEALRQAERHWKECEIAVKELEGKGEEPYARMLRARLAGDDAAHDAARVEFYADLHEENGTPPPVDIADAVTVLLAERRLAREH